MRVVRRHLRLWAIAAGVLSVFVTALVGIGQDQLGLSRPGEPLKLILLRLPAVQKELELTSAQKSKLETLSEETKEAKKGIEEASGKGQAKDAARTKGAGGGFDPAQAQGPGFDENALNAGLDALEQETERSLNKLLNPKQRTRLNQIALRVEGPSAFIKPDLIEALGLGEDQIVMIQQIVNGVNVAGEQLKESQKQAEELTKGLSVSPELEKISKDQRKGQFRSQVYNVNKQAMAQIARVLNRRQRAVYNKLLGPPFEFTRLADAKGKPLLATGTDLTLTLVKEPAVQNELGLSDDQKKRLNAGEPASKVLDARQRARLSQLVLQSEGPSAFSRADVQKTLRLNEDQSDQIASILGEIIGETQQLRESLKAAAGPGPEGNDPAQEKTRKEQEKARFRTAASGFRKQVMDQIAPRPDPLAA